jgi:hypothetical protein
VGRPHIEFIESQDVPLEPVTEGPFAGTRRRLMSEDDEDGASTAIVTFPGAWSVDLAGERRPLELFVLRGTLTLDGADAGPGTYAYLPPAAGARVLASTDGADALVMIEPEQADASAEAPTIIDTTEGRWQPPGLDADVPPGILIKLLRVDPVARDWTWVAATVPGWEEQRAEIHPTVEECLMLRGDVLLGERGVMSAGSYFWRPPMVRHGPMFCRNGGLFFFRTKGGGMDVTWEDVPNWRELVAAYVGREPYYQGSLD